MDSVGLDTAMAGSETLGEGLLVSLWVYMMRTILAQIHLRCGSLQICLHTQDFLSRFYLYLIGELLGSFDRAYFWHDRWRYGDKQI